MSNPEKPSVFKSLLDKRKQVETEPEAEPIEEPQETPQPAQAPVEEVQESLNSTEKRRPGRPKGRRSNPNYTQISAYIPLDLLLDVQEELAKEKRRLRKRSAMTVSELAETLLRDWLDNRRDD